MPRTIIINILAFELFDCKEFHSEFQALEVTRHTLLTDKLCLHYYELPKLPDSLNTGNSKELWLNLFNAETEEELSKIESLEVPIMSEAVKAYRHVTASPEFKEIERLRSKARHDEAQALYNAERREREKWQVVVAKKDAALADREAALANKDALIEELRALLDKK